MESATPCYGFRSSEGAALGADFMIVMADVNHMMAAESLKQHSMCCFLPGSACTETVAACFCLRGSELSERGLARAVLDALLVPGDRRSAQNQTQRLPLRSCA